MNLYEFNRLNTDDKLKSVWALGKFIDKHITATERVNLYGIDLFYVDIVYDPGTSESILS